ncbi:hypothetical protein PR048_018125 [Dryococelus australis]|uniref:EGF-like domain-containing protein n=1 Tax=Dryococelus australis TaxID=614101 RepID=A0ABQ9HBJ6_9NEOP|nr:hypothetical protein PR048_018125 [Dryococelus australis]
MSGLFSPGNETVRQRWYQRYLWLVFCKSVLRPQTLTKFRHWPESYRNASSNRNEWAEDMGDPRENPPTNCDGRYLVIGDLFPVKEESFAKKIALMYKLNKIEGVGSVYSALAVMVSRRGKASGVDYAVYIRLRGVQPVRWRLPKPACWYSKGSVAAREWKSGGGYGCTTDKYTTCVWRGLVHYLASERKEEGWVDVVLWVLRQTGYTAASSSAIPTCENPRVNRLRIEHDSPCWMCTAWEMYVKRISSAASSWITQFAVTLECALVQSCTTPCPKIAGAGSASRYLTLLKSFALYKLQYPSVYRQQTVDKNIEATWRGGYCHVEALASDWLLRDVELLSGRLPASKLRYQALIGVSGGIRRCFFTSVLSMWDVAGLGEACTNWRQCVVASNRTGVATCSSGGVCVCSAGYQPNDYNTDCSESSPSSHPPLLALCRIRLAATRLGRLKNPTWRMRPALKGPACLVPTSAFEGEKRKCNKGYAGTRCKSAIAAARSALQCFRRIREWRCGARALAAILDYGLPALLIWSRDRPLGVHHLVEPARAGTVLCTARRRAGGFLDVPPCRENRTVPRVESVLKLHIAAARLHADTERTAHCQQCLRLACSPPTKANRVQSTAGSPDFCKWESCRTMLLVGGFSRRYPVHPAPSFRRCSIFTSITLVGSEDLSVKSCPNLFTFKSQQTRKILVRIRSVKASRQTPASRYQLDVLCRKRPNGNMDWRLTVSQQCWTCYG